MTARVTKVVFDTNILVSGHLWKGPPYRCLLDIVTARELLDRLPLLLTDDSDTTTAR